MKKEITTGKKFQISFYVQEKDAIVLKQLAKSDNRTLSDFVRLTLFNSIEGGANEQRRKNPSL